MPENKESKQFVTTQGHSDLSQQSLVLVWPTGAQANRGDLWTVRVVHVWGRPTVRSPTPADKQVDDEVAVLREDDDEQGVEVQALHQQPEEVGHDEVLEKHQAGFTSHLEDTEVQTAPQIPIKRWPQLCDSISR